MTNAKRTANRKKRQVDFAKFLGDLMTGTVVSFGAKDTPPWFQEGVVCQITETIYMYHLEVLPPRWFEGNAFAFGEGCGPFQLFWKVGATYFGRQLSAEETFDFCRLSGTKLFE